jgi:hypothetical protein
MKSIFLCLLITVGFFSNAQKNKLRIDSLLIFRPITEIRIIKGVNKEEIDTLLTQKAQSLAIKYTMDLIPDSIITQLYTNSSRQTEIDSLVADVAWKAHKKIFPLKTEAPEQLLHILDSMNRDFGLGIVNIGFVRTKENQVNEYTTTRAMSFFSLGYINVVPNESFSTMFCFIIYRRQKKIYFFEKSMDDRNPTDAIVIKSQLRNMLMSYFLR